MNSHYKTAEFLAKTLDYRFKIGKFQFGIDPILGLFPGGGEVAALAISLYIVWLGIQLKVPSNQATKMLFNVFFG